MEALDVSILPGRTWLDESGPGADRGNPLPDRFGDELRAVVGPDIGGDATQDEEVGQEIDDVDRGKLPANPDRQALTGELVQDIERAVDLRVIGPMMHEVITAYVVGPQPDNRRAMSNTDPDLDRLQDQMNAIPTDGMGYRATIWVSLARYCGTIFAPRPEHEDMAEVLLYRRQARAKYSIEAAESSSCIWASWITTRRRIRVCRYLTERGLRYPFGKAPRCAATLPPILPDPHPGELWIERRKLVPPGLRRSPIHTSGPRM